VLTSSSQQLSHWLTVVDFNCLLKAADGLAAESHWHLALGKGVAGVEVLVVQSPRRHSSHHVG
jgi:hypothetical protein